MDFGEILENFQKPPGGIEGPSGGSCSQRSFFGFCHALPGG